MTQGGSPPRVRGTGGPMRRLPPERRITPACAGNSSIASSRVVLIWDHPRVCGEQFGFCQKLLS